MKVSLEAIEETRKADQVKARQSTEGSGKSPRDRGYFDRGTLKEIGIEDSDIEAVAQSHQAHKKTKKPRIIEEAEIIADQIIKDVQREKKYAEDPETDFNFHSSSQVDEQKKPTTKKYDSNRFGQQHQTSQLTMESKHNFSSMANESNLNHSKISKQGLKTVKLMVPESGKTPAGPSREAISLIFHYASLGYKTNSFLTEFSELTKSLQKVFDANMGELIIVDGPLAAAMSDADGAGVSRLKEEMADGSEVIVIRTFSKSQGHGHGYQTTSSTLTTMCNEINVMKFKRRIVFKRGKLLAPISLTFGAESKRLSGSHSLMRCSYSIWSFQGARRRKQI